MQQTVSSPWWRHGMVWLVIAGPATVIVAGVATLLIALTHPDPVLPTAEMSALQARNHALSGPKLAPLASTEGRPGTGQAAQ